MGNMIKKNIEKNTLTMGKTSYPLLHNLKCSLNKFKVELAHKKGAGSTKNGRKSNSKRLGLKVSGGQEVRRGSILVRQVGSKFHAGLNVKKGNDYTIYSLSSGIVSFSRIRGKKSISVYPNEHIDKNDLNITNK